MLLEQELKERTGKEEQYIDLLQRTQADFINYKHWIEREREEQAKFANADLILKLLPILDDFDRAKQSMPEDIAETDWTRGIELVRNNLTAILEAEGVSRIDAQDKNFDPPGSMKLYLTRKTINTKKAKL